MKELTTTGFGSFRIVVFKEMSSSSRAVATSSGAPVCPALPAGVKLERPQPFKG